MIEQQQKWAKEGDDDGGNKRQLAHVKENIQRTNGKGNEGTGEVEEDEENIPYYKHCILQWTLLYIYICLL